MVFFKILCSNCSLSIYRNMFDFCALTFYLATCLNYLLVLGFWQIIVDFLHRQSCFLCMETILFFPFQSVFPIFYFFLFSYCGGQIIQYAINKVVRMDILGYSIAQVECMQSFIIKYVESFLQMSFIRSRKFPFISGLLRIFIKMYIKFCLMFCPSIDTVMHFFLSLDY